MATPTRESMEALITGGKPVIYRGDIYYTVESLPSQDEIDGFYALKATDGSVIFIAQPKIEPADSPAFSNQFVVKDADENKASWICPVSGTLSQLFMVCTADGAMDGGEGDADGSTTFTVRKNGADTDLVASSASNAGAESGDKISDAVHNVSVAQGDVLSLKVETTATGSGNSGAWSACLLLS